MFFTKKAVKLFAPATGELKPITEVPDEVFSTKMMGDGFAVEPVSGEIVSPVAGTITTVFPTMHAIGLTTKQGLEVILHIGIDTVELNGHGFKVVVTNGESVIAGQLVASVDLDVLTGAGKQSDVIVAITNLDDRALSYTTKTVQAGQEIGQVVG
ncbi:PTS sugar transporter subunit IIA [Lacticaseibacillus daqingensis]|uniref:PTS sugar transporter subunit IIA n=1 Tax=Lacticaseibacillus daqingensis TaxID=2486014 RepID=UPI000F7B7481|nr:PTS glucose transporter subunit IIA [Lacticaseibacillus daqingensis]